MIRATLKSLLSRKLRLILSGLAVVLGVMFVSGSFVRVSVGGEGSDAEKRSRASGLAKIAIAAVAPPPGKTTPR